MILLNVIDEVTDGDARRYSAEVDECLRLVRLHAKPDERRVYENVAPDGSLLDSADGRLLNPGHAIEAGWSLQHWARRLGRQDLSREGVDMVRWSFAEGWDPEHGEWYGYLDRRGEVTHRFKGGPYKGCFHVPRALWLCWRLLQRLEDGAPREDGAGPS